MSAKARLEGKTALITGGNSGIGLATARRFVEEGARVVITGRSREKLDAAAAELGTAVSAIVADAASPTEMGEALCRTSGLLGGLDIMFLNAGIAPISSIAETTEELFDAIFATNVRGVFFTIQKALPIMRDGGAIIINGSVAGGRGMANFSAYSASKAAVRSFARTMSIELAPRGIRVNCVSPGPIATPIWQKTGLSDEEIQQAADGIMKQVPAGRMGTDLEVAEAVVYLASDAAKFVVGAELPVDGGMGQV